MRGFRDRPWCTSSRPTSWRRTVRRAAAARAAAAAAAAATVAAAQRPPSFSRGALPADFSRTVSRKRGHGGRGAARVAASSGCLGAKRADSETFFRRCGIGRLPESNLHLALPAAAPFPLGQLPAGGASAPHGFLLCSRAILCTAGARGQRVGDASGDRLAVCPPRPDMLSGDSAAVVCGQVAAGRGEVQARGTAATR
jgi:hypothetical protein